MDDLRTTQTDPGVYLQEAFVELEKATAEYEEAAVAIREAGAKETAALNRLNAAQKKMDRAVGAIRDHGAALGRHNVRWADERHRTLTKQLLDGV